MIDSPGKYLTCDGKLVTITRIEYKGPFPAKGFLHYPTWDRPTDWKLSGQYPLVKLEPHPFDIISKLPTNGETE